MIDCPEFKIYSARKMVIMASPSSLLERDRMAQGEPNQLYWVGFFLFGPFPEENMFGFS